MKTNQLKMMRRHRRLYRLIGFMFILVGGMLLFSLIPLVFDPSSTINYNGNATTSIAVKISATLFDFCFVLVGFGFLFSPSRFLDKLFIWRQSLWSAIAFWRL